MNAATVAGSAAARPAAAGPLPGSASSKAPPAILPGEHFAAALGFLLLGAAGAVLHAPDLAAGQYLSPRVAALTHLFTLGWITTSIMGALYQFLPVALDRPIRSVTLAHVTFALHVPGLLAFVTGLATGRPMLLLGGAVVMGMGVLLFAGNLAATLKSATRRDVTWWALALATCYLTVTLVLGLALTGNLRWGFLGGGRLAALGVHLHVALAGWVLLVMIGVGHRLLPMFLLSHGAQDRFAKAAVALVASGSGVLAFLHHAPRLVSYWLPAVLIAAGCGAFLLQARAFYVTRHRRVLDPGMRLAAGALLFLVAAMLLAGPVIILANRGVLAVTYVTAILLAVSLFVVAHYYKIVPFLVWYHRFGPLAGRRPVPRVQDLYSATLANAAVAALLAGAAALLVAIGLGMAQPARAAALVFVTGTAIVASQMLLLWRIRP
ncbi:MAG TPA: hypothetical protein VK929_00520 [Longimicrobiales bacterium]|nr:hypothetical protein [Longimicrobiales bacterium]